MRRSNAPDAPADAAGHSGDSAADTADTPDPGGDTAAPAAWVRFASPGEGATVENPVTFVVEGEGIDTLALSADGWEMLSWRPAEDGWSASYTFSGTGYERSLLLEGRDAAGNVVATDTRTVTVAAEGVNLDVPYYYQYDNRHEPSSTCGLTSTAMVLSWWLPDVTPDALYVTYGKAQAQSPSGIEAIYEAEGLYGMSTTTGTRAQIRAHLDAGRPVIAHGWWTGSGHVVALVGYDDADWIVNDPAGDWYTCYGCGEADHVRYPVGGAWDREMSTDGDVWFSVADVAPF